MTFFAALTLCFVMLILAALPSASVALVVTRSATHGVKNGAAVAAGIVMGDLVFVCLAILGMGVLAQTMGVFFAVFRYLGGAYLIWLGIGLLRSRNSMTFRSTDSSGSTMFTSLMSGVVLTLGDVKAILFYASLFPTFVDMANLTATSVAIIIVITIVSVGGVKLAYAFAAHRIVSKLKARRGSKYARMSAGGVMIGAGTYLIAKT